MPKRKRRSSHRVTGIICAILSEGKEGSLGHRLGRPTLKEERQREKEKKRTNEAEGHMARGLRSMRGQA